MISGLEEHPEYDFSVKYTDLLKTLLAKLEQDYQTVVIAREAEAKAIKSIKEEEDDYDSLLRKIGIFIDNELKD